MKNLILASLILFSTSVFASFANLQTAKHMEQILIAPEVKAVLAQDNLGYLNSISYVLSYRTASGPHFYNLNFRSGADTCTVYVGVEDFETSFSVAVIETTCAAGPDPLPN